MSSDSVHHPQSLIICIAAASLWTVCKLTQKCQVYHRAKCRRSPVCIGDRSSECRNSAAATKQRASFHINILQHCTV